MMNREIKFRVWDGSEMYAPGEKEINVTFYSDGNCGVEILDFNEVVMTNKWVSLDQSDIILMQFTGLYDKNGKEIFDGDHFGEPNYPVEFEDGLFVHKEELLRDVCGFNEVRGNIYENAKG